MVTSYQRCGIVLQVDGQGSLHRATSRHHRLGLQDTTHHTQGVMHLATDDSMILVLTRLKCFNKNCPLFCGFRTFIEKYQ